MGQAAARDDDGALARENAQLRAQLQEADDTLRALRNGEIDAIVVGEDVYTLEGVEASGNRFRSDVLAQMGDSVIALDLQGHMIYLNPAAQRQYGMEASQALGRPLDALFTREWLRPGDEGEAARCVAEQGAWRGQTRHLTHSGERLLVECTHSRLLDNKGDASGTLLVLRDMSQREAAQAALRESRSRLLFTLEAARVGEWSLEPAGGPWRGSLRHAQCFGYGEEVQGWTYDTFISHIAAEDRPHVAQQFCDTLRGESRELHFEARVQWPDGTQHWIEMHGTLMGHGTEARLHGIVWDTTERKQAEAWLRDADQRKDEFLATLAHELRNPLAPIRNSVHLMRLSSDADVHQRALVMIERQLVHMVHLVDDLLDVSRISLGRIELRRELVDVAAVVDSALEASRPAITAAGHRLSVQLPAQPMLIDADATRMSQVLSNLLNNAAKYTPDGGEISLSATLRGDTLELAVRDNGLGIPPDMLPRVFEMFTQVNRTLERSQGGLGIGLALVKRLVEMHGGTVHASSEGEDRGSVFTVSLPVRQRGGMRAAVPGGGEAHGATARAGRVLVVDDNRDSAESLSEVLRLCGYDVLTAYDGSQAVVLAASFEPQAVLLDIGLPLLDGYEAARLIRERPSAQPMLVALTGWGQEKDLARSAQAGFDHHLVKPVPFEKLLEVLATLPSHATAA